MNLEGKKYIDFDFKTWNMKNQCLDFDSKSWLLKKAAH